MWQAVNHALCKANICLWSTLSNSLSVWMSVWMYLFCLLCMYNMSMYICIRVSSTVGTGALICCIIVLYLLYWIKKKIKKSKDIETERENQNWHMSSKISRLTFLSIPCWLLFLCGEFLLDIRLWLLSFFSFLSREFPSQIQSYLHFYLGSFSYTSLAGLIFTWGDSLRHPVIASFFCAEVLLHIPCWLLFPPPPPTPPPPPPPPPPFFFFFFFLNLGNFTYTSFADFIFLCGASLTHPVLALFFCGVFLLHILCWLYFSVGSFSNTSHAVFFFSSGEFHLHIPCWLHFYLGSFSYTSRAGFTSYLGSFH